MPFIYAASMFDQHEHGWFVRWAQQDEDDMLGASNRCTIWISIKVDQHKLSQQISVALSPNFRQNICLSEDTLQAHTPLRAPFFLKKIGKKGNIILYIDAIWWQFPRRRKHGIRCNTNANMSSITLFVIDWNGWRLLLNKIHSESTMISTIQREVT